MSGLHIHRHACTGCGLCVDTCASGALSLATGTAQVEESKCVLCSLCVDACPNRAITLARAETSGPADHWRDVWVFAEQRDNQPAPVVLELLTQGRALAGELGQKLCAVLAGGDAACVTQLQQYGADVVFHCGDGRLSHPEEALCAAALTDLVTTHKPAVLLFGATPFGRSLAPRVAARLGTGLTADCTQLAVDPTSGLLLQTRPAFGGNLMATITCPNRRPQMATVRPGVFQAALVSRALGGTVSPFQIPQDLVSRLRLLRAIPRDNTGSVSGAPLIITAGRGIGVQKNLKLVHRLAELLGAQVGASRPLVEAGWISYDHQIGQTGCSVSPKLLITFGVSGAIQHLAGIGGAQCVVAVNSDPEAPIFSRAHYGVVGDCQEVLTELILALEQEKI